jgi:hypothetical protein
MEERWKDIPNYLGLYQVSNIGNVINVKKNKLMSKTLHREYLVVKLSKNNIGKQYKIHRLVGLLFVDNPDNKPFINHKDEIKTNNIDNNLEWCDSQYNNTYGTRIQRQIETKIRNKSI